MMNNGKQTQSVVWCFYCIFAHAVSELLCMQIYCLKILQKPVCNVYLTFKIDIKLVA